MVALAGTMARVDCSGETPKRRNVETSKPGRREACPPRQRRKVHRVTHGAAGRTGGADRRGRRERSGGRVRCVALILVVAAGGLGCTEARLRPYRDDRIVEAYRYALGERYAEVDGLRLCYQEFGQGDMVLILPGLGTSIDFWQLNIPV